MIIPSWEKMIRQIERGREMEIYYKRKYTDEEGHEWLEINGDTAYDLTEWTEEEAIDNYTSPEHRIEMLVFMMEAFGYYD